MHARASRRVCCGRSCRYGVDGCSDALGRETSRMTAGQGAALAWHLHCLAPAPELDSGHLTAAEHHHHTRSCYDCTSNLPRCSDDGLLPKSVGYCRIACNVIKPPTWVLGYQRRGCTKCNIENPGIVNRSTSISRKTHVNPVFALLYELK